ncbi:hypothetical protein J8273_6001 [Carpediemonas membranifera]|uniref:Uncharacterized protein n=1 Tax=Carpediemonas membranifera TaxID=201153 RepID=A0A8J6B249_9EUKA|nr:hypothetical protein J8273_6001 [Carpediemonas membranifera]|eukprot:KAG9392644.1 hypothetical protein J8273_6001 [Carpediemonas membranifera]
MAGTGPGGGGIARLMMGWMCWEADMGVRAVRIRESARDPDRPSPLADFDWGRANPKSVIGKLNKWADNVLDLAPSDLHGPRPRAIAGGWKMTARDIVTKGSRTAKAAAEVLAAEAMQTMAGGRAPKKPKIIRGEMMLRRELKRVVATASNTLPSASNSHTTRGAALIISRRYPGQEMLCDRIQRICPICTLAAERELINYLQLYPPPPRRRR